MLKVAKFGGSSVANTEQMQKVCKVITADPDRRIVVVSAPGKRHSDDIKVTDLLIATAEARLVDNDAEVEVQAVIERFREIQIGFGLDDDIIDEIEADLRERMACDIAERELFLDRMKAAGEDNCAKIFARALAKECSVEAHYVDPKDAGLLLSDEYGNAQVLPESYERLAALADAPGITVFPGFFGYTPDGMIATLPRGGSDITGAILAAAVKADLYENFTDVDNVYCADPRVVENPKAIDEITYAEMRELSYAGFSVFHDEAIQPAVQHKIPVAIKNTNRPEAPGTRIVPSREYTHGEIAGVASSPGFISIYVDKYLMNRELGFARRLLQIIEDEGVSLQHMPSGIDNVSIIVDADECYPAIEKRIIDRIQATLEPDRVEVEHGLALVMIVGEGMSHTLGVAGRATSALAKAGINLEMINQGASEISMMFGVKEEEREDALRALYNEFVPSGE